MVGQLLHATGGTWGLQGNADELRGAFEAAGAFKLAEGSKDAAMVLPLPPGNWTVQVGGGGAAGGVALIEIYALPQDPAGAVSAGSGAGGSKGGD
jgi:hypothetical protein